MVLFMTCKSCHHSLLLKSTADSFSFALFTLAFQSSFYYLLSAIKLCVGLIIGFSFNQPLQYYQKAH